MNYKETLKHIMVLLALAGFLASSIFMFYQSFTILEDGVLPMNYIDEMNKAVVYISSLLTAMVGGIVAAAFGFNKPTGTTPGLKNYKLHTLGTLTRSENPGKRKNRAGYGFAYALAYILIGITAVIIWIILEENTTQGVSNMATTFLGMMVPIVASFFSETN